VREKSAWLLWGILLLGFSLRVVGIQFGLPHLYHADEPIVVNHALAYGTGDFHPHFFKIPPLVSYLLFICYGVSYLVGKGLGSFRGTADFEHLFFSDPTLFYLLARLLFGALAGTLSVYLLYRLVRKHFSEEAALVSSFFFATAFLPVRDAHYIYADTPLLLVLIGSYFAFFPIVEGNKEWKWHLGAGALVGLATATKYNGVAIIVPYMTACLLSASKRGLWSRWLGAAAASILVYSVLNPYTWFDFSFFVKELREQAAAEGGSGGVLHHFFYSLNGGVGPLLLISGMGGLLWGILQREKKRLVLASFLVAYYLLLAFKSQPYDRYVLPLIPFLLFFAGDFLVRIVEQVPKMLRRSCLLFLVVLTASPSIAKAVLLDRLLLEKDVRTVAREWVESTLSRGTSLALDWEFYLPRLAFSREQLEEKYQIARSDPHFSEAQQRRLSFLLSPESSSGEGYALHFLTDDPQEKRFLFGAPTVPFDLEELRKRGIEYVLIARVHSEYEPSGFYEALKKEAELVKRFTPYRDPDREFPYDRQPLTGTPFLWKELVSRERNGQPIEVFKLK